METRLTLWTRHKPPSAKPAGGYKSWRGSSCCRSISRSFVAVWTALRAVWPGTLRISCSRVISSISRRLVSASSGKAVKLRSEVSYNLSAGLTGDRQSGQMIHAPLSDWASAILWYSSMTIASNFLAVPPVFDFIVLYASSHRAFFPASSLGICRRVSVEQSSSVRRRWRRYRAAAGCAGGTAVMAASPSTWNGPGVDGDGVVFERRR